MRRGVSIRDRSVQVSGQALTRGFVPQTDLENEWRLDEGAGDTAHDSAGEDHGEIIGIDEGNVQWTSDSRVGSYALQLDHNAPSTVKVDASAFNKAPFTILAWTYIITDHWEMDEEVSIIGNYDGDSGHMFRLRPDYDSRDIEVYQDNEAAFVSDIATKDVFLEQWNHIAASVDENRTVSFYVNGTAVGTDELANDSTVSNLHRLGSRGDDDLQQDYGGILDHVVLYSKALSEEQVRSIYRVGL